MSLEFVVTDLGGSCVTVSVAPWSSFADFKAAVEALTGVPADAQRMICGSKELASPANFRNLLSGTERELQLLQRKPEVVQWLRELSRRSDMALPSLASAPETVRADAEVALAAVRNNAAELEFVAAELRCDRSFSVATVHCNADALRFVDHAFQQERAFVLDAVALNPDALAHALPEFKADYDIVLAAVARDQRGGALRHAAPELRANPDIVLAAVAQNGYALQHAVADLKAHRDIVVAAVSQSGYALQFADAELRADRDVVKLAVARNSFALHFAAPELRADREIKNACSSHRRFWAEEGDGSSDAAFIFHASGERVFELAQAQGAIHPEEDADDPLWPY